MSKHDGGPAFPRPMSTDEHIEPCNVDCGADGMTLRDYFAAKALQGDMAYEGLPASNIPEVYSRLAEVYYQVADAMLEARKQEGVS